MSDPKTGDLKVWWIPQVPMKAFETPVRNINEARLLVNTLARYDIFQYEHKIKPDYANVGGLLVFEDGEWSEWSDDQGRDINDVIRLFGVRPKRCGFVIHLPGNKKPAISTRCRLRDGHNGDCDFTGTKR